MILSPHWSHWSKYRTHFSQDTSVPAATQISIFSLSFLNRLSFSSKMIYNNRTKTFRIISGTTRSAFIHPHDVHNASKPDLEIRAKEIAPTQETGSVQGFILSVDAVMQYLLSLVEYSWCYSAKHEHPVGCDSGQSWRVKALLRCHLVWKHLESTVKFKRVGVLLRGRGSRLMSCWEKGCDGCSCLCKYPA